MLLFNADIYNPFFIALGLLLGATSIGLGYGGIKLINNPSASSSGKTINVLVGMLLFVGCFIMLGLAAFCVMWVAD